MQTLRTDLDPGAFILLDYLHSDFAAERGQLSIQISHPRLFGVMADQPENGVIGKQDVLRSKTIGLALFVHQILLGDVQLLHLRVSRNPDNFHPVLQRSGNTEMEKLNIAKKYL